MRAYVFTDASLKRHAGQFVWLAINTEHAETAAFRRKFPVEALPTFFVLDPVAEKVILRWVGGATVAQLHTLFDQQSAAYAASLRTGGAKGAPGAKAPATRAPADAALARADALYGEAKNGEAAQAYLEALAAAPANWPSYRRTVEQALFALSSSDQAEACAKLAREALPRLGRTASAGNVAGSGLDCALQLPKDHPQRAAWVAELEAAGRRIVADSTIAMAADDRSGLYIVLLDARDDAADSTGRRATAEAWARFLERQAARAKTADARAVFDSHRLSAYLELGTPEQAIPMLQASEAALPDDYNPPARLAVAWKAMKKWPEALAASDRALARAYGPRKLLLYQARVEIYEGMGDVAAERRTLADAIAFAEALPEGQRSQSRIDAFKKKLGALK